MAPSASTGRVEKMSASVAILFAMLCQSGAARQRAGPLCYTSGVYQEAETGSVPSRGEPD